jgi:ribosome modulation factor
MELKLLPKPWPKLSESKQNDIIDRLRDRVDSNVKMAVHLIASQGRTVVAGDLEQITIKGGVKAVVKFGANAPNLHELYDVAGKAVLVVVADAENHTSGMDEIRGDGDQRVMDLGHEYHDNDGGGMDGQVVDAEFFPDAPGLPAPGDTTPTQEELDKAYDDGYQAAAEGKPESDCPVMRGELCIQWVKGWKDFINGVEKADMENPPKTFRFGALPNEHGVYTCTPDEIIEWGTKKDNIAIELLELENGKWLYATDIQIGSTHSSGPLCLRHGSANSRAEALRAVQSELVNIYSRGEPCGLKGKALQDFTDFVNNLVGDCERKAA